MSLEVVELHPDDDDELTEFLDGLARVSGSVLAYHYPFYRNLLVRLGLGSPVYLGVRRSGQLCGFLPAFSKESSVGTVFCSLPFFGPNAGVLCGPEDRTEIHATLLGELVRRAEQSGALSCAVYTPFLSHDFALYDEWFGGDGVVNKFTQCLDLSSAQWPKEIQYELRKAERASVTVTTEVTAERLAAFYEIYRQNCSDYGIPPKPWECVEFLADEKIRGRFTQIYFAILEGTVIAGLLVLFSPATASYYMPCSLANYRSLQPGTLLIAKAMEDAKRRGLNYWNWESSPDRSGVYQFKKKWGSREEEYRTYVKTFQSVEKIRQIGRDRLASEFPYYFVWPYDRL